MGLLVQTSFTTPQGMAVQSVYVRIFSLYYELQTKLVMFQYVAYISRTARVQGFQSLEVPGLGNSLTTTSDSVPSVELLYLRLRRVLESNGFTIEDVLEDGQAVTQTLPPDPEPVPPAPFVPAPTP